MGGASLTLWLFLHLNDQFRLLDASPPMDPTCSGYYTTLSSMIDSTLGTCYSRLRLFVHIHIQNSAKKRHQRFRKGSCKTHTWFDRTSQVTRSTRFRQSDRVFPQECIGECALDISRHTCEISHKYTNMYRHIKCLP